MRVSVIGGSSVSGTVYDRAVEVGRLLGEHGHTLVCGGLGGVMEAACRGMDEADGRSIGMLPGRRRSRANRFVDTAIATGLGSARNVLVVLNGEAVIAIDGATGTLSEIGHAADMDRPIAGLGTHDVEYVTPVDTPSEAVEFVEERVQDL